ncbi:MAG: arabinogalactan endo-1,4-beta-galactosidase [Muribaculaceae bacterium]|nr:arabinogalactan endo-1,4-beta-galactosidase [Muribaculaceae bacterium]
MCNRINLHLILSLILCLLLGTANAEKRYVGGDISLLPLYEEAGAKYKTHEGEPISDVLSFCKQEGMNAMRVRVFVNPEDYSGKDADPNACQTIESVLPLCKRIKDQEFDLVLDFMYSDTWADPAKQWTPKQWKNLNDEELCKAVYDYTKNSLTLLKDAGVIPDFIQTGNEISYGMLWGSNTDSESNLKKTFMGSDKNWKRLGDLLNNAISACHEVCPDAKIILHTERIAAPNVQRNFYNQMKKLNVDYDIIGISYYPYFHGSLSKLETAINDLEANFKDKDIMVVETGYSYKWEVPGTSEKVDYPYSDEGQNQFAKDLVNMLLNHDQVIGLLWWWMEYNAFETSLSGWYNAPLFDSLTGKATSALTTICSFAKDNNSVNTISETENSNVKWYDINGNEVTGTTMNHGLFISSDGQKILK